MVYTINHDPDHKLFLKNKFVLSPFPQLKRAFTVGDDFLNIIYFRPNDIVPLRSFQSFTRIMYSNHSNEFLPLNFDHGKTY